MFKWRIELGEDLVETIAYGYAKASNGLDVIRELKERFKNELYGLNFVSYKLESNYIFTSNDLDIINNCKWEQMEDVKLYVAWEG